MFSYGYSKVICSFYLRKLIRVLELEHSCSFEGETFENWVYFCGDFFSLSSSQLSLCFY